MEQSKIIDTLETYHQVTSRFIESTIATRLQSMIGTYTHRTNFLVPPAGVVRLSVSLAFLDTKGIETQVWKELMKIIEKQNEELKER